MDRNVMEDEMDKRITDEILAQLEEVRASGAVNMLDRSGVQVAADDLGHHELVMFIEDCREERGLYMEALEAMGARRQAE